MKHLYTFTIGLLSLAAGLTAEGKVAGVSVPGPYPHTPSQSSTSTAIVNSRLIAKSYYEYKNGQFTAVDSSGYQYSGGRGGSPDELDQNDDNIYFDVSHHYTYSANTWQNSLKRIQTFGVNNRIEMLYYQPWDSVAQNWIDIYRYTYSYNTSSQITKANKDIWDGHSWYTSNTYPYTNSYNTNGTLHEILAYQQDYLFYYDNDENLICRTVLDRPLGQTWHYTINDSFCYDALGRVSYILHQVYDLVSGSWVNDLRTTYNYAGAGSEIDYSIVESWNTAAGWQKKEKHLFTYDGNHNKLSDVTKVWNAVQGAYIDASRILWTYNPNNQIASIATATWSNTAANWVYIAGDYQRFFYYEMYFPTSIKNLDDVVVNMDLFPSPAQDAVHFRIDWRAPQPFSVGVTDMQGRVLQQWDEKSTKNYEHTLNVSQWAAGNYLLTVSGEAGRTTRRFVVAR